MKWIDDKNDKLLKHLVPEYDVEHLINGFLCWCCPQVFVICPACNAYDNEECKRCKNARILKKSISNWPSIIIHIPTGYEDPVFNETKGDSNEQWR